MKSPLLTLVLTVCAGLAFAGLGGGCVAFELRDELHAANSHLGESNQRLGESVTRLDVAGLQMERASTQIGTTEAKLAAVEASLASTNERLGRVESELMQARASLATTNKTLEPVSRSLGSVGGALSLLGLGDEGTAPPPAVPGAEGGAEPATAQQPGPAPATGPNLLLGTWLLESDLRPRGMVLLASGESVDIGGGGWNGTWTRNGKKLTFNRKQVRAGGEEVVMNETWEVLTLTPRLLTLRAVEDGRVVVYTRP